LGPYGNYCVIDNIVFTVSLLRRTICFLLVFFGVSAAFAQDQQDKDQIYNLVLKDFIDSVARNAFPRVAVPDSTCEAVFYGGFPDSVNKKYFGFEENSYFDAETFRKRFIDTTKRGAPLAQELFADTILLKLDMADFRAVFSSPKLPGQIIISDKGFDKLRKLTLCDCFCEVSKPFFITKLTALIYLHYQCGMENGFPNVYLMIKRTEGWAILTKLRGWNFE
jgi:hypothetical protein